MTFPPAVPEVHGANVDESIAYYVKHLGFEKDWGNNEGGIGGVSRGDCRLFLTNAWFRSGYGNDKGPVLFWLNVSSKAEVDELYAEWKATGARLPTAPEDKPWKLREFIAEDLDGNRIRVFYDFSRDDVVAQ